MRLPHDGGDHISEGLAPLKNCMPLSTGQKLQWELLPQSRDL